MNFKTHFSVVFKKKKLSCINSRTTSYIKRRVIRNPIDLVSGSLYICTKSFWFSTVSSNLKREKKKLPEYLNLQKITNCITRETNELERVVWLCWYWICIASTIQTILARQTRRKVASGHRLFSTSVRSDGQTSCKCTLYLALFLVCTTHTYYTTFVPHVCVSSRFFFPQTVHTTSPSHISSFSLLRPRAFFWATCYRHTVSSITISCVHCTLLNFWYISFFFSF